MRTVTKYAMLALLTTSFIALNNCGNQSSPTVEPSFNQDENGPASDYAILPGAPIGYPIPLFGPPTTIEVNCDDGLDNDGNGWTDCEDPNCQVHPECSEWGPPLEEIWNSRALTVYPNGILVPEDVAFLNVRGTDDDDVHNWQRNNFFPRQIHDCWIDPKFQDPYFNVPLGEALIVGPDGPIGPQLFPATTLVYFGPRAGLIDECEFGTNIMDFHMDDDNGVSDDDGRVEDEPNQTLP